MTFFVENFLLLMTAYNHVRLFGLPPLPIVYISSLIGAFWFFKSFRLKMPYYCVFFSFYLCLFFITGVANSNPSLLIAKDCINFLAAFGFFSWGYRKFQFDYQAFYNGLKIIATNTVVLFVFLWTIFFSLKLSGAKFYFQIQMDLLPIVVFGLMLSRIKYAYIKVFVIAVLSNKIMLLVSTFSVLILRSVRSIKSILVATLCAGCILLASNFSPDNLLFGKYIYSLSSILDRAALDRDLFGLLHPNSYRGREVLYLIENYSMGLFGGGAGYGSVFVENNRGLLANNSFIHVSVLSIAFKIGYLGVVLAIIFFGYLFLNVNAFGKAAIFAVLVFGLIASLFAAYMISSWLFWYILGASFGATKRRGHNAVSAKNVM